MVSQTQRRVSDEVWAAAPVRRLPVRRVVAATVAAAALLFVGAAAWTTGLVVPQLEIQTTGSASKAGSATFDYRFFLLNRGSRDITLTGISTGAPWLAVTEVTRPQEWSQGAGAIGATQPLLPLVVAPSTGEEIRIVLTVDCAARTDAAVPLLFDVDGFARSHTVALQPEPATPLFAGDSPPDGLDRYALLPWPQSQMDWVCNPYRGDDAETG